MEAIVRSQHHDVLAAGSVISFNEDHLVMHLPLEGEDLSFILSFGSDPSSAEKPSVEVIPHGERKLELKFINFDYDMGTGNNTPIEVGVIDERALYFSYRVYSLADSNSRLLHYTFYLKK